MKRINISFLFPMFALIILVVSLSQQLFNAFPLGKLLDPFTGAVQNEEEPGLSTSSLAIGKTGLSDSVQVFFDKRKVPHIYAKNAHDLYFAQGYVTAYLRLWQMDFLSYVSAGRMSEIFSDGFLGYDRNQRRIGLLAAARKSLKMIEQDTVTFAVLTAYSGGVNAYIKTLKYRNLPLEYKVLDYEPEPWSNLKTVLLMKYMGNTLSGYEDDYGMSYMMLALGEKNFNKLYPDFPGHISPIVRGPVPDSNAAQAYVKKPDYLDFSFLSSSPTIAESPYNPKLGSNSWAISGKKTASGFPILCNDPHLSLSLPSIWLEMQLSSPGVNVYGVSIPGTPAVIIGFNENIAWGLTNGADDVKDWYKLKVTPDYRKYELDGQWVDLPFTVEEIKRKGQHPFYDTVYQPMYGPIVNTKSFSQQPELVNYALRWELHRPSNEFLTYIRLNKAKDYGEYREAIKHAACPVQNFTFACRDNTIAITHQGKMAEKSPGQGKFIMDGTSSAGIYKKYIPEDSLPQEYNPACGFVLSANQHPTYAGYKYYYNGYYSETRANRIRQMLEKGGLFDLDKMEAMQLDNTNAFAADALPVLANYTARGVLNDQQRKVLQSLSGWKGNFDMDDVNAKFFDMWWRYIKLYTWDEFKGFSFYTTPPADYVLLDLIRREPGNDFFDRQGTTKKEDAGDVIYESFLSAYSEYISLEKEGSVRWGDLHKVNVMHMTNIAAFSRMNIPSAGHPEAINAMSSTWGPSWRMIVELGDRPKAFGVYAGGQSGNIGSRYYDNFVDDWNKGRYYPLVFFMSKREAEQQATTTWTMK